jgi:hypothetical protein
MVLKYQNAIILRLGSVKNGKMFGVLNKIRKTVRKLYFRKKSYRLCCVVVCDLETSRIGAPYIYIYDISSLMVHDLTLILLTWRKW